MSLNFQKIYNTKINLNADAIISKIEKTIVSQNLSVVTIIKDNPDIWQYYKLGTPFWQQYKSGICFARNFYKFFPDECDIVVDTLKSIKNELHSNTTNTSDILSLFLNSTFIPIRVNLMKIPSGVIVEPHTDVNRSVCINIGLKNSNSAITYVSEHQEKDFWNNPTDTYQMEDGDVYLLNVKKTHAVKYVATNASNLDRYIITYTLLF